MLITDSGMFRFVVGYCDLMDGPNKHPAYNRLFGVQTHTLHSFLEEVLYRSLNE